MLNLKTVGLLVGGAGLLSGLLGLLLPQISRKLLAAFPRNRASGCLLTVLVVGWAFWLLYHATFLAGLPMLKKGVIIVAPVCCVMIIVFLDELLAARALGGLLLLLPQVVLAAAFPHDQTRWRLVLTTLAYVWVISGIVLLLSPYYFRRTMEFLAGNDVKCRVSSLVSAVLSVLLLLLSATVY